LNADESKLSLKLSFPLAASELILSTLDCVSDEAFCRVVTSDWIVVTCVVRLEICDWTADNCVWRADICVWSADTVSDDDDDGEDEDDGDGEDDDEDDGEDDDEDDDDGEDEDEDDEFKCSVKIFLL